MHKKTAKKETVLVTGGAGFIGSHLVDALIRDGYHVRIMDALIPSVHAGKIPSWINKRAEFMKGDVRRKKDWMAALPGVSYVFHLAGYMDYHHDFSTYVRTNTESVALLYELIVERKYAVKKIILASSQSVYGNGKYECATHGVTYPELRTGARLKRGDWAAYCHCGKKFLRPVPQREDDVLHPEIPYAITKRSLEDLSLSLGRAYHIPTTIVRYSIVHGSRQSFRHFYSGALRSFSVQLLSGEEVLMQEDGGQTRDFVHVDDVTQAHLLLLKTPRSDFEIYNVGSGRAETVMDLYQAVCRGAGVKKPPYLPGVYRVGTARDSLMDISKLKHLGWKPQKTLADNARDYIKWIKAYPEAIRFLHASYRQLAKKGVVK